MITGYKTRWAPYTGYFVYDWRAAGDQVVGSRAPEDSTAGEKTAASGQARRSPPLPEKHRLATLTARLAGIPRKSAAFLTPAT